MSDINNVLNFIKFYENLSKDSLSELDSFIDKNIYFKDPFNKSNGIASYREILEDMFKKVPDINFIVTNYSYKDTICFIKWSSVSSSTKLGKPWVIEGVSEIEFSEEGKVIKHLDYWDSSLYFYELLPFIGSVLRFIRRLVSVK